MEGLRITSRRLPRLPRCQNWFKRVRCSLPNGHPGNHEAEFPRYHCHVDANGRETPDIDQPFRWDANKGKIRNAQ